jgi:hypothetical protein
MTVHREGNSYTKLFKFLHSQNITHRSLKECFESTWNKIAEVILIVELGAEYIRNKNIKIYNAHLTGLRCIIINVMVK